MKRRGCVGKVKPVERDALSSLVVVGGLILLLLVLPNLKYPARGAGDHPTVAFHSWSRVCMPKASVGIHYSVSAGFSRML